MKHGNKLLVLFLNRPDLGRALTAATEAESQSGAKEKSIPAAR
jgi:hypothetical protein